MLETLINLWKYDVEVFSEPWMYIPFGLPAAAYLAFFFMKWTVLTAPAWLPVVIIIRAAKN